MQMLRCARTGLYFSFIPQETVYIQSPVHRLYSVCCQSCFDIYRTTSVISLIISVKFQINLHTFACTHTCFMSFTACLQPSIKISCILPHNYTCVCFSLKRRNRISLQHKGFVIIPMMMLLLVADSTSCFHVDTGSESLVS